LDLCIDKEASIRVLERRNARTLVTRTSPYIESASFCASITILLYEAQYPERWLVFPSYRCAGRTRRPMEIESRWKSQPLHSSLLVSIRRENRYTYIRGLLIYPRDYIVAITLSKM